MKEFLKKYNIITENPDLFKTIRRITVFYGWFLTGLIFVSSLYLKNTVPLTISNTAIVVSLIFTITLTRVSDKMFARVSPVAVFLYLAFIHLLYTFIENADGFFSSLFYALYLVPIIVTSLFFDLIGAAVTIAIMFVSHLAVEIYAMNGLSLSTYASHFLLYDLPYFIVAAFIGIIGAIVSRTMRRTQKNLKSFNTKISHIRDEWVETFDSISDPIIVVDLNYDIKRINTEGVRALSMSSSNISVASYEPKDFVNKNLTQDFPEIRLAQELTNALEGNVLIGSTNEVHSDNKTFDLTLNALQASDATSEGTIIVLKDITAKRRTEKTLRKSIRITNTLYKTTESILSTANKNEMLAHCLRNFKIIDSVNFASVTTITKNNEDDIQQDIRMDNNELSYNILVSDKDDTVIGKALNSNKNLHIADIDNDDDKKIVDGRLLPYSLKSIIATPIIINGSPIGTLNIGSYTAKAFSDEDISIIKRFSILTTSAMHNISLHEKMEGAYLDTVLALSNAIDAKSPWTQNHSIGVANLAVKVAKELGLDDTFIKDLNLGVLLHDIGKIGIRDDILNKSSALTQKERVIMSKHVIYGANIIEPIDQLKHIVPIVKHHHENFDGTGYPAKLAGDEIPLGARIVNVTDSFEAMTTTRPYSRKRTLEEAKKEMQDCAGKQFDPEIVEALIRVLM